MSPTFIRCEVCGIIFPDEGEGHTRCPKCLAPEEPEEAVEDPGTKREILRTLKNALRDAQSSGQFLTVPELAKQTEIEETKIWDYIQSGEIDTASFDDPKVRDFLVKKRREQLQGLVGDKPQKKSAPKKPSGFHTRSRDDKR